MDKKEIILQLILVLLAAIGGAYIQDQLSKQSLESELVIVDMHLEEKKGNQIINQSPFNFSLKNAEGGEIKYSFLEANITVVNSVYSKYPLKIIDSRLDFKGGTVGEITPIFGYFSTEPIYPSKEGKILQYVLPPFKGNYNLTGLLIIWYYDPMTDKIKSKDDEVFILKIRNGKLEKITPLKEYITIKGYTIEDYGFGVHG